MPVYSSASDVITSTTTTTTHHHDNHYSDLPDNVRVCYRSNIAPRTTTISRRRGGPGHALISSVFHHQGSGTVGVPLKPKNAAVIAIVEGREKEKRELAQLNDKFASYVERVRFLEVHNKKLQMELDALKNRVGGDSGKIRDMYEIEIREAKYLIDETNKDKAKSELRARAVEDDAERFRKRYHDIVNNSTFDNSRIEKLNQEIASNEAEINLLKRRLGDLEDEAKRYKIESQRLLSEIQRLNSELEAENVQRVQLENEKHSLEEEVSFLKQLQAQELEDLRASSFMDCGIDSSQFFKSELANAIREIRNEYEQINNNQRTEMEHWYSMKVEEMKTRGRADTADNVIASNEVRKLRTTVTNQRREVTGMKAKNAELETRIRELEELLAEGERDVNIQINERDAEIKELRIRQADLMADYEELTRMKGTLEEEIQTYRRLLEGENGERGGLKQVVEGIEQRVRNQEYRPTLASRMTSSTYTMVTDSRSSLSDGANLKTVSTIRSSNF